MAVSTTGDDFVRPFGAGDRLLFSETPQVGHPSSHPLTAAAASFLNALNNQGVSGFGTAATGVTATEYGDGIRNLTKLTFGDKAGGFAFPAIAGGANLAVGALAYTFPAGDILVGRVATYDLTLTEDDGNITADTPDVGIGTVIGTGVVAVLGGTATFEDILTGQTSVALAVTDVAATVNKTIQAAAAHTVYLNAADGWAASGEDDMSASGDVWLEWMRLTTS